MKDSLRVKFAAAAELEAIDAEKNIDRRGEARYDVWADELRRDHYGPSGEFWTKK